MQINTNLFNKINNSNSQILAVTKYWNNIETDIFIKNLSEKEKKNILGFGENRIENLFEKNISREKTHFIGNIQSKQLKHIVKFCDTIHSIDNMKHIKKLEEICQEQDTWVKFFLQINLDKTKTSGINYEEIPNFLKLIDTCDNISLIGFSAIGKGEFTRKEKKEEFQFLKKLKTKYLPHGLISAGTSRDYEIALEEEIDIIRIGKNLVL